MYISYRGSRRYRYTPDTQRRGWLYTTGSRRSKNHKYSAAAAAAAALSVLPAAIAAATAAETLGGAVTPQTAGWVPAATPPP